MFLYRFVRRRRRRRPQIRDPRDNFWTTFWISLIFGTIVSEIMWHKWYFCKLYVIKWKWESGISVADTVEILIPLSCSKTSICKHHYQVSHHYNDVEKENRSHDKQLLNTVGMRQDGRTGSRISNCWCGEDITVWYISGNTCIIIMQFIHIVQFEILFLTVYIHDIEQDHCIFIPGVLYILLFCSK